jgi:ABC-type phosphate transport system permease subunit
MKNQNPADYSDAELLVNEKRMKTFTFVFAGVLIILFITTIITLFIKGFTSFTLPPKS